MAGQKKINHQNGMKLSIMLVGKEILSFLEFFIMISQLLKLHTTLKKN